MNLYQTCQRAVGRRVKYTGTNGDEYDKANHGKPVAGEGICMEQHDSHGLCIIVQHDDGSVVCVDPITVEIPFFADPEDEAWVRQSAKTLGQWAKDNPY
jgi:hypothetical protein